MFTSAFVSLRKLKIDPVLAAIAAIAFVVTPYFAVRVAGHDYLSLYCCVPFGAALPLVLALSANNKQMKRSAPSPYAILAILFIGTSGFY